MNSNTVGIVGGGQLARMLALAGIPLGLRFVVLDPAVDACAGQVAELIQTPYDNAEGLAELAARADVITFDFENVPAATAEQLQTRKPVFPPPQALALAQDRLAEKSLFRELGINTPAFATVDSLAELQAAVQQTGLPAVLKTRRFGYDGKGQRLLKTADDMAPAWQELGETGLILEQFITFQREVSVLAVAGRGNGAVFYPLVENQHRDGILRLSQAPYQDQQLQQQAYDAVGRIIARLNYVGVLAVEFFVVDGQLLANEMAPRVHNSGHWTIEGAVTSQFENHLRAVLGLALGDTRARGYSAMLNCIGAMPDFIQAMQQPEQQRSCHWHDYGKAARAGRKVGHITLCRDSREQLLQHLAGWQHSNLFA